MPTPLIIDIADAVTAELTGSGLFLPGAVQRLYRPRKDLQELTGLAVSVVPRATVIAGASRSAQQVDSQIDVALQQKLVDETDTVIDPLMTLVDQTVEFLTRRKLALLPGAAFLAIRNEPIYGVEHMDELRVFTSVITVTYRTLR